MATTQAIQGLLYGVSTVHPLIFGGIAILVAVAALACYIPALRAPRRDPMSALRYK